MKLRIARKMDQRPEDPRRKLKRDKRKWWRVYNIDQLKRAQMRLQRSWMTACPPHPVEDSTDSSRTRMARSITDDFFVMNRVNSRRIRLTVLRRDFGNKYR